MKLNIAVFSSYLATWSNTPPHVNSIFNVELRQSYQHLADDMVARVLVEVLYLQQEATAQRLPIAYFEVKLFVEDRLLRLASHHRLTGIVLARNEAHFDVPTVPTNRQRIDQPKFPNLKPATCSRAEF